MPEVPAILTLDCPAGALAPSEPVVIAWLNTGGSDAEWLRVSAPGSPDVKAADGSVAPSKSEEALAHAGVTVVLQAPAAFSEEAEAVASGGGASSTSPATSLAHSWLPVFEGMVADRDDQASILITSPPSSSSSSPSSAVSVSPCDCALSVKPVPSGAAAAAPVALEGARVPVARRAARSVEAFDFPGLRASQQRRRASLPLHGRASATRTNVSGGDVAGAGTGSAGAAQDPLSSIPLAYDDSQFSAFITENVKIGSHLSFAESGRRLAISHVDKAMETGFSLFRARRKQQLTSLMGKGLGFDSHRTANVFSAPAAAAPDAGAAGAGAAGATADEMRGVGDAWTSAGFAPTAFLSVEESIRKQGSPAAAATAMSASSEEGELVMLESRAQVYSQSKHSFALSTGFIIAAILEGLCPNAIQKAARKTEDTFENLIIPAQVELLGGHHDEGGAPEGGDDEAFIQVGEQLTAQGQSQARARAQARAKAKNKAAVADEPDGRVGLAVGPGIIAVTTAQNIIHILPVIIRQMSEQAAITAATDLHPFLVDRLRDITSHAVSTALGHQLPYFLAVSVNEVVTDSVHRLLPPYVLQALTTILTHTVTRSVTHALTGTLLHSLSTSPQHEGACYRCHDFGQMCDICYHNDPTRTRMYTKSYYSQFFASYYGDYYSNYYIYNGPWRNAEGAFTNDGSRAYKEYGAEIAEFAEDAPEEEPHPQPPHTVVTPWPGKEALGEESEAPQAAVQ